VSGGAGSSGSSTTERIRDDPNDQDEVKVFKCAEDEGENDRDDVINDDKRDLIRSTECDQVRKKQFLYILKSTAETLQDESH
jgi:hypothetical protein